MQIPKENRSRFSESDFEFHNHQITRLPISLVSAQLHQFVLRWLNPNQLAGNALVRTAAIAAVAGTARQLQFVAQLLFELLQLLLNADFLAAVAHHVFAVALQEVADRLHANPDRAGRLVLVDILEAEVRRAGVLHDLFDHRVDRRVVAALEAGKLQRHQVGMPRDVLRGPHLAAGVLAVASSSRRRRWPADAAISPATHFLAEQPPDDVVVDRQAILREHRVAELLELFQDLVIDAGIVVIRPAQQHHAEAVFALELLQHFARRAAHGDVVEVLAARDSPASTARLFSSGERPRMSLNSSNICRSKRSGLREVDEGVQEPDALLLEEIAFLDERRLHRLRRGRRRSGRYGWPARCAGRLVRQSIIGKKMMSSGFFGVHHVEQVVHVRDAELRGEAGVDGAALGAFLVQLLAGVVGVDDVLRLDAERLRSSR